MDKTVNIVDYSNTLLEFNGKSLDGKSGLIRNLRLITEYPTAFKLLELELSIPSLSDDINVYKEDDISITFESLLSCGKRIKIDAFYYEDFLFDDKYEMLGSTGKSPSFRIRISPPEYGLMIFTVTLAIKKQVVDSVKGCVFVEKNNVCSKLLKVEPKRRQTFKASSGETKIMIGENLCWSHPTLEYGNFAKFTIERMKKLSENGANYVRIWDYMDCRNHIKAGINKMHIDCCAMWDQVFEQAEKLGIYISFVLMNHGEVSTKVDARWHDSIWHTSKGGYLTDAKEFFTDRKTIDAFKSYVRYIVSRWSYTESIMAYELFNEIDHTDAMISGMIEEVNAWAKEISDYIRFLDPYGHMVTNNAGFPAVPPVISQGMDFVYYHMYNNAFPNVLADVQTNAWRTFGCPVLIGEAGFDGPKGTAYGGYVSKDLWSVHQGNWAGVMGGGAGTAMFWFWPQLDEADGYKCYKGISKMAKRIPWNDTDMQFVDYSVLDIKNNQMNAMGYCGKDYCHLWFYDNLFTHMVNEDKTIFDDETIILNIEDGQYSVCWIDTSTGDCFMEQQIFAENGILCINMPPWSRDIAVSIKKDI